MCLWKVKLIAVVCQDCQCMREQLSGVYFCTGEHCLCSELYIRGKQEQLYQSVEQYAREAEIVSMRFMVHFVREECEARFMSLGCDVKSRL